MVSKMSKPHFSRFHFKKYLLRASFSSTLFLSACSAVPGAQTPVPTIGFLYNHTIEPLTLDFKSTPARGKKADSDTKQFSYSQIQIKWNSNGLGNIAKKNNVNSLYYADVETLSILGGLWQRQNILLYGE